ncbi:DUF3800 domain-containing protein [Reyranella sp.]|uniref:DUF3800 domain-containing protein n=1 Tax=Reyranella sp. TaxID=1929291 RepID=UPI003F71E83F
MSEMLPVQKRSQIFGDDSSKTGHTYFVYGSLHVPQVRFRAVEQKLKLALGDYPHEIKWNETRYLNVNVAFLNALMDCWSSVSYRCIVVSSNQINQAQKAEGRALLRAKLVYVLLNRYARTTMHDEPEFYVTLDKDDFDPEVQEITLNRAFLRDHGGDHSAFKVRAENSKDHLMLQAVDLLTGAVAWVWNGGLADQPTSNAYRHRYTLASLIAKRTRIAGYKPKGQPAVPQGDVRTLGHYTVKQREKGFGIFHVDLTKSRHRKLANGSA